MEIGLTRVTRTGNSTIGDLTVNGISECFILEDMDRGLKQSMALREILSKKIHGKTAIPAGRYEVAISFSNRFKKKLPLLLNVPGFEGIRIHPGNTANDSEGCLLTGKTKSTDFVGNSRAAFATLFAKIEAALKKEKVFITIS